MHQKLILITFFIVLVSVVTAFNSTEYKEDKSENESERKFQSELLAARGRRKKLFYGLGGLCMIISCHFS